MKSSERQKENQSKFDHPCSFCEKFSLYMEAQTVISKTQGIGIMKVYFCQEHVGRSQFYGGVQISQRGR